jgi:hypothetical protein
MSSTSKEAPSGWLGGGLYPSVMFSDCFNTLCHLFAAHLCYREYGSCMAAVGFASVATAAAVGTYRFGFNESFDRMNGDLADLAAFVGLPMVGLEYYKSIESNPLNIELNFELKIVILFALLTIEAITRSMHIKVRELLKTLINVLFFVSPVVAGSYLSQNYNALGGIIVFVIAAVVIEPDRHRRLLGIRREDWFHYLIGLAAPLVAQGLQKSCSLPAFKDGAMSWRC